MELLDQDKPMLLIASPMCTPFSSLQNINHAKMDPKDVEEQVATGLRHLKFTVDLCIKQWSEGRYFMFEHPMTASSWESEMLKWLGSHAGVEKVSFDFCALGMQSKDQNGELGPSLKKTSVLTNSKHIAAILGKAKCRGQHQHVRLEGGRAAAAQIYPEVFCDAVCHGLKLEMQDTAWLDKVYEQLNITKTVEDLIATQVAEVAVPPDEESDLELYKSLYKELEFMDDVSGQPLDKARAVQARKAEMDYFKSMQVYS
jgi:hypothetical protein